MTVFLILGVAGLALLAVSLLIGDLLDGAFDALEADWFSSAVIGGSVSAFGFGAAAADGGGLPTAAAVPIGIVAGIVVGWFAWWLTRLVKDGNSDGTVTIDDTVGRQALVITAIPDDGFGVVRVTIGGHSLQYNARSYRAVPAGEYVDVSDVLSPTAVTVNPVWRADA